MSKLHFTTKHANEATVQRNWYVVDGTNQTVGRMCARIAAILRGKNKAYYTPHIDCGDFIIVINSEKDGITVEVAMWWNDSYHENVLCFTNNIPQRDGGTHLAGFRGALTRIINKYAEETGIAKKEKVAISGDDAREGIAAYAERRTPKFAAR